MPFGEFQLSWFALFENNWAAAGDDYGAGGDGVEPADKCVKSGAYHY
ncbi:hypothetical protein AGMMS49942_19410 [Spirochaetia bacterium]|nr:hypothetical protein AGMMS49942_19410 [Spirochaetia bacterium]